MCPMWMTSPVIPNPSPGDGLQVCLPLPKEVGDCKFWIPLPSQKLYSCLWESGVCSPQ